jgi:DNA-binding GntR family transcriptional regulator
VEATSRFEPPRLSQPSKVELVLEAVRRGILRGELRPGAPLSLTGLSGQFGISPGPLREALRRLEGEGLVELRPSRSAIVAPIDAKDLREIYRLRISIEGDLVAASARLYTDEQLARMTALLDALEYSGSEQEEIAERHTEFHRLLLAPAASAWDWRILDTLWAASGRYLMLLFEQLREQQGAEGLRRSHAPLVEAAHRHAARDLRRALTEHLEEGVERLTAALDADAGP